MTSSMLMTADDLLRLPDDGHRYELLEGRLVKMAPVGFRHGRYAARFCSLLGPYVHNHQLGIVVTAETGFRLASDPDTVRAPDVAFVSRSRAEDTGDELGFFAGAPDLALEVVSPNDSYTEVESKALLWLEAGSKAVVVLDPGPRTLTVYRSRSDIVILTGDDILDLQDVVTGWTLPLRELFF